MSDIKQEIQDGISSMLELNLKHPILVWAGGISIGAASAFIDDWVSIALYNPSFVYYTIMGLVVLDHVTGVAVAFKYKKFQTSKFLIIIWKLLFQTTLMVITNTFSTHMTSLFWLNEALLVPIILINLASAVKNGSLLGLINPSVATWFHKNVDTHKNVG